jgi:hypothetical protein
MCMCIYVFIVVDEDIDGVPMDDDDSANVRNKDDEKKSTMPAGFVPSRWETVDPDQVSKCFCLEGPVTLTLLTSIDRF